MELDTIQIKSENNQILIIKELEDMRENVIYTLQESGVAEIVQNLVGDIIRDSEIAVLGLVKEVYENLVKFNSMITESSQALKRLRMLNTAIKKIESIDEQHHNEEIALPVNSEINNKENINIQNTPDRKITLKSALLKIKTEKKKTIDQLLSSRVDMDSVNDHQNDDIKFDKFDKINTNQTFDDDEEVPSKSTMHEFYADKPITFDYEKSVQLQLTEMKKSELENSEIKICQTNVR